MLRPDRYFNQKKYWSIAVITLGASLILSGCKDGELGELLESVKGSTDTEQHPFCEAKPAPFAHALCQVAQNDLLEANSPLSLHLFWKSGQWQAATNDSNGSIKDADASIKPLYKFNNLLTDLPKSSDLKFAVNAGMYNTEFAPIGYTVIKGHQILSLNLNQGAGNFHLLPNGVLWWDKSNRVSITETHKFNDMLQSGVAKPWYATQSGPMLVIEGKIHPKFNVASTSLKIRNGVGLCEDGHIKFVTSNEPVNFYQFASLFKDELKCPNALFLDGGIASALYAPDIDHQDNKNMGVMVGLVEDLSNQTQ